MFSYFCNRNLKTYENLNDEINVYWNLVRRIFDGQKNEHNDVFLRWNCTWKTLSQLYL